jgi:hypothetical protein
MPTGAGHATKPVELGKLSTIRRRSDERQIQGDQKTCRRQPAFVRRNLELGFTSHIAVESDTLM